METVAAAAAVTTAGAAYLNAKYHISKDLRTIRNVKRTEKAALRAGIYMQKSSLLDNANYGTSCNEENFSLLQVRGAGSTSPSRPAVYLVTRRLLYLAGGIFTDQSPCEFLT